MIELLRAAARARPAHPAVVGSAAVSYQQLCARAERVAGGLRARKLSRFAVQSADVSSVIAAMAGASLAGAEACVYPADATAATVPELAARFDHDVVLDDVALAELASGPAIGGPPPADRPHLILTSGTTALPRAARHDWSRLLRGRVGAAVDDARWLLAFNIQQFAALQVILHVLSTGTTLVVPPSPRPSHAAGTIETNGVTHVSATPTFWRFLLATLPPTVAWRSALRQVTLGGEASSDQLLADLRTAFPNAKVSHVYAATEFGSTGSVRDAVAGLPVSVLARDGDDAIGLKVVDGELWVRSGQGMLGYYGEPPIDPDAWRPTGDLVEVVGDRILFLGRVSETINVGGVKVHPLAIEEKVIAVPGVRFARVFGRANRLTGQIVAVEVVPEPGVGAEDLDAAIRIACADLPAAARPRSITFVDKLATNATKVIRQPGPAEP